MSRIGSVHRSVETLEVAPLCHIWATGVNTFIRTWTRPASPCLPKRTYGIVKKHIWHVVDRSIRRW